jgi:hypothetical protein
LAIHISIPTWALSTPADKATLTCLCVPRCPPCQATVAQTTQQAAGCDLLIQAGHSVLVRASVQPTLTVPLAAGQDQAPFAWGSHHGLGAHREVLL